jgi:uncharacterized protein YndB with AHSA1/START domain
MMPSQNFSSTFIVEQSPAQVFDAINDVRGWWTGEIEGDTNTVGDVFSYRYPGFHYSQQEVAELVPDTKVVWRVIDARLEGHDDPSEWTGTDITFEIESKDDATEVRFTHVGLVPEFECFDSCSSGWGFFVNHSLRRRITTGEGPATPPWA